MKRVLALDVHPVRVLGLAALLAAGVWVGRATANQPHMQSALDHLQSAKAELEVSTHDKGGHRVNALRLVNEAIGEVHKGIAAGR